MPIYEYRCAECKAEFEVWQKISEKPIPKCEKCGSRKIAKLISQTSFQLKGTGWYVTDYARKGGKAKAESTEVLGDKAVEKSGEKKEAEAKSCGDTKAAGAVPACKKG